MDAADVAIASLEQEEAGFPAGSERRNA